jgi:hypothetical protein
MLYVGANIPTELLPAIYPTFLEQPRRLSVDWTILYVGANIPTELLPANYSTFLGQPRRLSFDWTESNLKWRTDSYLKEFQVNPRITIQIPFRTNSHAEKIPGIRLKLMNPRRMSGNEVSGKTEIRLEFSRFSWLFREAQIWNSPGIKLSTHSTDSYLSPHLWNSTEIISSEQT